MSYPKYLLSAIAALVMITSGSILLAAQSKPQPPVPAHAKAPSPAVTNEFIHKQFGDNCSLMAGPPQFVADLDDDGVDDLVVAARCVNPMADQGEYAFRVIDPYHAFFGFGDVRITSNFASDVPERRGVSLLIIHGAGDDAWRAETPKAKFLMINLPFKTITVKKMVLKKRTVLGIYMEETGEGESTSSVVFWDGKKYKYQQLGSTME